MSKCLLCQQREADKTGSHIIPSFLMKRVNGNGKRDHEIGFKIIHGIVDTYFGRDVYEEKRKDITNNEEKFYSRENYDVVDHILCKDCEVFFASLESKYAPSLNLHFSENATTKNTKISPSDALLFWCSLIWRASVTGHLGSRLSPDLEEKLRLALVSNSIENLHIKYAVFRCKDYSKQSGNGTFVGMDIKANNVLMFVDDFMLVMVFDMKEEKHKTELFEIGLELKKENLNDGKRVEEISPIPYAVFSQLTNTIIRVIIKSMQLSENFKELHREIFNKELPEEMLDEILEMMQNTGKLGDKYTVEHYVYCYKEILKKYGLIIENEDNTFSIVDK